jgi:adenosylmethionine-8-amino-7-oxononanoate aminotransferase
LDAALRDQLEKVAHSTLLGNGNTAAIALAEDLSAVLPVERPHLLFASDGAAAVEQALKIAFQYWTNQGITGRDTYLAFGGAYHGDTIGSLSVGAGGFGTDVFDPLRFPVLRAPDVDAPGAFDTACALVRDNAARLAAVVIEPLVQGAAGMRLSPPDGIRALAEVCRETGVLLIADEVATGFGRTGTLFASEQCGIRPDLMCIGKGLTGGYLPMAATVASGAVFDAFLGPDLSEFTLYHGHSFSGNALCAAVARRHLQLFAEWDVLANVRARAAQLAVRLGEVERLDRVAEVRQQGLMVGVELAPPTDGLRWGRRVCAEAVRNGVLLRPLGDVVVLMPILTSTAEEIDRIADTLIAAINALD